MTITVPVLLYAIGFILAVIAAITGNGRIGFGAVAAVAAGLALAAGGA
jgi:hypothetical protein